MSKDMKLIMERFRKNLNEMPAGLGMPLKVGAATAAGKAYAARKAAEEKKEEERRRMAVANQKFVKRLSNLGNEPEYIEIEPGDIKGIDYPELVKILNGIDLDKFKPGLSRGHDFQLRGGNIIFMLYTDAPVPDPRIPQMISGRMLARIMQYALVGEDLYPPDQRSID